jgi:DNA gyrase/topoisomerase IV subunit B
MQLVPLQHGAKKTRLTGIPKLDDANDAGGRNSEHCTLILTEGDSAKAGAVQVESSSRVARKRLVSTPET